MKTVAADNWKEELELARALHKHHGKSYYFATRFFPKKLREATHVLYAFVRVPDEIVDSSGQAGSSAVEARLDSFISGWRQALVSGRSDDPVLNASARMFRAYKIPAEYSEAFLKAMRQDVSKARYATYRELEEYMYGSAAAVGLMMCYIIGFKDGALPYAKKLGEAMQLTNILRDVGDDYRLRNRIYIPQEDLDRFGVMHEIEDGRVTAAWRELMKFEVARARSLYRDAEPGVALLARPGRLPVRLAARLYESILTRIEERDFDVFSGRASTSFTGKIWYALPIIWNHALTRE
jgi:phytoene synthase